MRWEPNRGWWVSPENDIDECGIRQLVELGLAKVIPADVTISFFMQTGDSFRYRHGRFRYYVYNDVVYAFPKTFMQRWRDKIKNFIIGAPHSWRIAYHRKM